MRKIIFTLLLTALSLVQISCKTNDKKSVLIIAVDELTITDVTCSQEEVERSGFQLLCNESVRFTHAFSPSTLSVPALASLMTGLYPYQHKIRHNSGPGLAAELELVSEVALKQDYRTSFFSGGAPVFRRSGLNQGFELFDDNIIPGFTSLFRPFKKNSEAFMQWLKQDVDSESFLSVIYAPDLLFTTTETVTDLGETRNLSFESQIDELDESLYELFQSLKSSNRWDQTTVILVGLNGHTSNDRYRELSPLNLHGENTQVALFIKPSQKKKRDEAIHWKVDQNVSLVDVGRTLFELLGESIVDNGNPSFPTHSLLDVLKNPNTSGADDRPMLIESGWAMWRKAGPLRTAGISNHVLYINDEKPLLYNTLVDRFEVNPLPLLQESILPTTQRLQGLMHKNQFPSFPPLESEWLAKLSIPFARWMRVDQESLLLRDLKRLMASQPRSLDLLNWTAQIALNQKDWDTLKNLGTRNKVSVWQYVGERNLNSKNPKTNDACFYLLSGVLETEQLKNCGDPLFLEFIDWVRAEERGLSKEAQRKRFERSFKNYMLDQQIQRTNIAAGLIWDTSRDNIFAPSRTELALSLPEFAKLRNQVYKSIQSEEY
ncbi:sulfatase-like hydrolase/transferase [Bdellovibrio bacteriovorus]|uniref:sulfatase-like hydrolase/transferase n=1 Tax=Bdellovibrio TaxID=958 RepID=UPI0035A95A2C